VFVNTVYYTQYSYTYYLIEMKITSFGKTVHNTKKSELTLILNFNNIITYSLITIIYKNK